MRYIIIGASAAGIAATKAIIAIEPQSEITVISADKYVYSRVKLHQYLSGESDVAGIGFIPADFFEKNNISWESGIEVQKVDTVNKCVSLEDGRVLTYDKLLIASGANAFVPPLDNFREAKNVFGLRTMADAQKIISFASKNTKCVIIGSGLVGLDAATALRKRGVEVTLLEMADRLSPLQLDQRAAKAYQTLFEDNGCKFRFSVKASGGKMGNDNNLCGVLLEDGEILKCDFVIVAAGVRSNVGFLDASGIEIERGIKVDSFMKTNVSDVFAAGDAAGIIGFWMGATKQGEIAGKNMCGANIVYEKEEARNAMNYYGLTTMSMGGGIPEDGEVWKRDEGRIYQRVTIKDGVIIHAVLQGDISKAMTFQKKLGTKI